MLSFDYIIERRGDIDTTNNNKSVLSAIDSRMITRAKLICMIFSDYDMVHLDALLFKPIDRTTVVGTLATIGIDTIRRFIKDIKIELDHNMGLYAKNVTSGMDIMEVFGDTTCNIESIGMMKIICIINNSSR